MALLDLDTYMRKGTILLQDWEALPRDKDYPKESPFTKSTDRALERWGWVVRGAAPDGRFFVRITLENTRDVEGVPATNGYYQSSINAKEGVMIAESNFSPGFMVNGAKLPGRFVQRWSDVACLQWKSVEAHARAGGVVIAPLRFIVRCSIINDETLRVMEAVHARAEKARSAVVGSNPSTYDSESTGGNGIREDGGSDYKDDDTGTSTWEGPPLWPGITFGIQSEEGRALLATPNGKGIAHMHVVTIQERARRAQN